MEKEKTPDWLIEGAYHMYCCSKSKRKKLFSFTVCIVLIFYLIVALIAIEFDFHTRLFSDSFIVMSFALAILAIIGFFIEQRQKAKYGNYPKWQKKYLQSKIDEAAEYERNEPSLIEQITKKAATEIEEIRKNVIAMKEKASLATSLLAQIG